MPDVKQLLKDEFSRLARKEFKKSTEPLMKQVSALKIALAEQKKKIALLEKEIQAKNIHPLAQIVQEPLPALGGPDGQRQPVQTLRPLDCDE